MVLHCIPAVVCDPACENGACVANDTCKCSEGYEGEQCTEKGMKTVIYIIIMQSLKIIVCVLFKQFTQSVTSRMKMELKYARMEQLASSMC